MRQMIQKSAVLYNDELRIVLQSQKIREFYGFFVENTALNDEEVILHIHDMQKKGFIEYEQGTFVLCSVLSDLVSAIKNGSKVIIFEAVHKALPMLCVYPWAQLCVVAEAFPLRENTLKVTSQTPEELVARLEEDGYYPADVSFEDPGEFAYACEAAACEAGPDAHETGTVSDMGDVLLKIRCYDTKQKADICQWTVFKKGLYMFIKKGKRETEVFTTEMMENALEELII